LLKNTWQSNSKISEIIKSIPKMLKRMSKDYREKIFTYYGEYYLNEIYDMNEFLVNRELTFIKCDIEDDTLNSSGSSSERSMNDHPSERYIVITEVHILIFIPVQHLRNLAKLIFISELRELQSFKVVRESSDKAKEDSKTGVLLQWDNKENNFDNIIFMKEFVINEFKNVVRNKVKKLTDTFLYFQDDIYKPNESIWNPFRKHSEVNARRLLDIIKYKENLYANTHDKEIQDELILLYQRVIEVLSAGTSEEYVIYMKKLQELYDITSKI
jgi:hypothetical protein